MRQITIAIDNDINIVWGAAEGADAEGARRDACQWMGLEPAEARRRAARLRVVTIRWEGDLPEGQDHRALAAAAAARAAARRKAV